MSFGMCAASSGVRLASPFFRTAATTSRGVFTANIGTRLLAGEQEDVAVVEPVVAPVLVPAREADEPLLGQQAVAPLVEEALLGVGIHLEADHDVPARRDERARARGTARRWNSTLVCSSPMSSSRVAASRAARSAGVIDLAGLRVGDRRRAPAGPRGPSGPGSPMARCSSLSAARAVGAASIEATNAKASRRSDAGGCRHGKCYHGWAGSLEPRVGGSRLKLRGSRLRAHGSGKRPAHRQQIAQGFSPALTAASPLGVARGALSEGPVRPSRRAALRALRVAMQRPSAHRTVEVTQTQAYGASLRLIPSGSRPLVVICVVDDIR